MLVEMYENNGFWCVKDNNGIEWQTSLISGDITPKEVECNNSAIQNAIELKEVGFTADEIFRLLRKDEK